MTLSTAKAGPITAAERILFIDVLRGMALCGILAANMRAFSGPLDVYDRITVLFHDPVDIVAQAFVLIFIQTKFISIFSFLFGLGFAVQFTRAQARGAKFLGFYPRRLAVLALFGLIHLFFIWAGDILLTYALSGALLLLFRNRKQTTLLWWAGGIFAFAISVMAFFMAWYWSPWRPGWMHQHLTGIAGIYATIDAYRYGDLPRVMQENFASGLSALPAEAFAIYALALFLLGLWVWRQGIVQHLEDYRPLLRRICAWCLPAGLVVNAFCGTVSVLHQPGQVRPYESLAALLTLPAGHVLAAGYIAGLALIFQRYSHARVFLPFAAVGRMALTNYLLQSTLCTTFYFWIAPSLYGGVGPAWGLLATVGLYAAQLVFSALWLTRYRFGPMEWLWRGLTYGSFPALRHHAAVPDHDTLANAAMPAAALPV
jgi:uncharacterized protein